MYVYIYIYTCVYKYLNANMYMQIHIYVFIYIYNTNPKCTSLVIPTPTSPVTLGCPPHLSLLHTRFTHLRTSHKSEPQAPLPMTPPSAPHLSLTYHHVSVAYHHISLLSLSHTQFTTPFSLVRLSRTRNTLSEVALEFVEGVTGVQWGNAQDTRHTAHGTRGTTQEAARQDT